MNNKQASLISRWFIKNHKSILSQIGGEATRKLWQFAENNGVSLKPKRRGRPKAGAKLEFIPGGDLIGRDIDNAVINWRVKTASDLARLFGILTKGAYLSPSTPMKSFFNYWNESRFFPWEEGKPVCTYKSFTEAVGNPKNTPNEEDIRKFEAFTAEFWDNGGCEEPDMSIDGELYTLQEYNDYMKWVSEEAD